MHAPAGQQFGQHADAGVLFQAPPKGGDAVIELPGGQLEVWRLQHDAVLRDGVLDDFGAFGVGAGVAQPVEVLVARVGVVGMQGLGHVVE